MNKQLNFNHLIITIFIIYFLIGLAIFDDYSVTPDEELHRINGLISLKYVFNLFSINLFESTELLNAPNLYEDWRKTYGVIFDLPIAFLQVWQKINNQDIFLIRHFLNFIIFFFGCIYFFRLINENLLDKKIALFGTIILFTTPRIFSHSFYNSKDIIFLSLIIIAVFYCIKLLQKNNFKSFILAGLFCALATNIRVIGIYLPILTFIFYFFKEEKNKNVNNLKFFVILFFIYFTFVYLLWPFLWEDPFKNFFLILKESATYPNHWKFNILYLGEYLNPEHIPWHYFFIWFSFTTPFIYLIFIILGFFLFIKNYLHSFLIINFKKNIYLWQNNKQMVNLFIFLNFFIPIFFIICLNSTLYNGWRHLFFLYPFLIYLSLYGVLFFKNKVKIYNLIISLLIFQTLTNVYFIYKSHPIQNVYFNIFANKIIEGKMPIDYWGLGNKKTIDHVLVNNKKISISTSSFTPLNYLEFSDYNNLYSKEVIFSGTNIQSKLNSDFIFTNYYYDKNPTNIEKYSIPINYKSYYKLIINDIIVNELFTK